MAALQGDLFDKGARLPATLGRVQETNEFYQQVAAKALEYIGFHRSKLAVRITRHGFVVVDEVPTEIDMKFHVITINHRTDPDLIAEELRTTAFNLGFDEGVRRGRARAPR